MGISGRAQESLCIICLRTEIICGVASHQELLAPDFRPHSAWNRKCGLDGIDTARNPLSSCSSLTFRRHISWISSSTVSRRKRRRNSYDKGTIQVVLGFMCVVGAHTFTVLTVTKTIRQIHILNNKKSK